MHRRECFRCVLGLLMVMVVVKRGGSDYRSRGKSERDEI